MANPPKAFEVHVGTGNINVRDFTPAEVADKDTREQQATAEADADVQRRQRRRTARDRIVARAQTGDQLADALVKVFDLDT